MTLDPMKPVPWETFHHVPRPIPFLYRIVMVAAPLVVIGLVLWGVN